MAQWLRINDRFINLDAVADINVNDQRANYSKPYDTTAYGRPVESAVVFTMVGGSTEYNDNDIVYFDPERTAIIAWLDQHLVATHEWEPNYIRTKTETLEDTEL